MNVTEIQSDKELMKKLKSIYETLNSVIKDDATHDKFDYFENELSPGINHQAVNQHIAKNRLIKITALKELSENWDAFKLIYRDDNIIKKIGAEFIQGKFEFNDYIKYRIQNYPHEKEVLYYFQKGVDVKMPDLTVEDYKKIKEQILPSIQAAAAIHLEQKKSLLKTIESISSDTSQKNLDYLGNLTEENGASKILAEYGTVLQKTKEHIKAGDFICKEKDGKLLVEVPLKGITKENGIETKSNTTVLTVDLNNPKNYSFKVGSLDAPENSFEERLNAIRKASLGDSISKNRLQMN